jgi:putative ABC transport system permease protein
MNDFTILRRSLAARSFSTTVTIITVAVAVALMLVLLTLRESGKRAFERGVGDMHMLVTAEASPLASVLNSVFYASPPRNYLPWERYEQLLTQAPWAYTVPVQMGDSYRGFPVVASNAAFFARYKPNIGENWELREGRFFENDFEVVVGAAAASASGLKVGDEINLTHGSGMSRDGEHAGHVHNEYNYKVVGILQPTGGAHDRALMTTLESSWIIHAHDRIEAAAHADDKHTHDEPAAETGHAEGEHAHDHDHDHAHDHAPITVTVDDLIDEDRKITGVYLRLVTREGSQVPANLQQVFDTLRRDRTINVAAPFDEIRKLDIIVGNVNRLFVAVAAVVVVSSAVAILLALYNSMEQRKRQIAIFRVLGASRGRVFGLILTESALIGLLGVVLGIALSILGSSLAAGALKDRIGLVVNTVLPPRELVAVCLATIALAIVAGVVPALKAYRTSVYDNLRPGD